MAIAAAAIGAGIGAAGSIFAGSQSASAARENYKHRYQWQVKDLQKAGLNPMLAISQGAPNVPQPHFPDVGEAASRGASSAVQMRVAKEQMGNIQADTRLKESQSFAAESAAAASIASARGIDLDNQMKEFQIPFGARNAEVNSLTLDRNFQIMGRQLEKLGFETGSARLSLEQQEKMNPILMEAAQLANQALRLGMPRKEVMAGLWDLAPDGKTFDRIIEYLKDPRKLSRDAQDWFPRHYQGR